MASFGLSPIIVSVDAGDTNSYPGTGQTLADLSGNANDFWLGSTSAVEASDPTWHGSANGLSANEYFQHDGGDWCRSKAANPAAIDALHKANAVFTILALIDPTYAAAVQGICGTGGALGTDIGFRFTLTATGLLNLQVANGAGGTVISVGGGAGLVPANGIVNFIAMSIDVPNNKSIWQANDQQLLSTATYTAPSAAASTQLLEIGARGGGSAPAINGTKIFACSIVGAAATSGQLHEMFLALRKNRSTRSAGT
jgi:hypothetical protein